jgi:hypothetical protein
MVELTTRKKCGLLVPSTTNKLVLLASLYFAQGLPYGFFTQAVPFIMREEGLDLSIIAGVTSALALLDRPLPRFATGTSSWLHRAVAAGVGVVGVADGGIAR